MPSRKKAKGKARRAAKANEGQAVVAASTTQQEASLEAQMQRLQIHPTSMNCNHGMNSISPRDGKICQDFIIEFIDALYSQGSNANMRDAFLAAHEVTEEEFADVYSSKLEIVVSMLLSIGAQLVIEGQDHDARFYATLACHLEEWRAVKIRKTKATLSWAKVIELGEADDHTFIAYYRKRIPCSCLDKKYKEVKSVKKMGYCYNPSCSLPNHMAERSKMFCCARCGEPNYCSIECQKADWKNHKEVCERLAERKAAFASG